MPFFLQKEFLTERRRLLSSRAGKLPSSRLTISPWLRAAALELFPAGWDAQRPQPLPRLDPEGVPSGGILLIPESPRPGGSQEVPAVPSPCPVPQCPQLPTRGCLLNEELWIFPTIGALDRAKKTELCLANPGDLCEPPGLLCLCSCLWEKSFISSSAPDALQEATASFWGGTGLWRGCSQGGQEGRLPPLYPDPKGRERPPRGSHGSRRVLSGPVTTQHAPSPT